MQRIALTIVRAVHGAGILALAIAVCGCAITSPSMLGAGHSRSAFSDPKQSVFAPSPQPAAAQPPGQAHLPAANTVLVQDGDTITDLAQRHKVSISGIMSENRLKDPNIFPGMVLRLPKR